MTAFYPFKPTIPLAVTTTSAEATFSTNSQLNAGEMRVINLGPNEAFFRIGTAPQTAVTTDTPLQPGESVLLAKGGLNSIAAICASGTATLRITAANGGGGPKKSFDAAVGTAGAPSGNAMGVQGIAGGTPIKTGGATTATALLSAVLVTGAGATVAGIAAMKTYQLWGKTSAGTGTLSVNVEGSNDGTHWDVIQTISLVLGTSDTSDSFASNDRYLNVRGNVTAITGTDAQATLNMAA